MTSKIDRKKKKSISTKIVVATCVLHNFVRKWNGVDKFFEENMHESLDYEEDEW